MKVKLDKNDDMLDQDSIDFFTQAIGWGHSVKRWWRPERGGWVYKLIYNPNHTAPGPCEPPPSDWAEVNADHPADAEEWIPGSKSKH